MADAASITISATILPDEIAKTINGSMTVTPADANHKWYYKLTSVSNSSTDLMAGYWIDYLAIDDDTLPIQVATTDTVAFLFIKNTDTTKHVYVNTTASVAASAGAGNFYVNAGETWVARMSGTLVSSVDAISSTGTVNCIVAAIIDDVSV